MTNAPAHFVKDFDRLSAALLPYTATTADGFTYIKDDAPESLVRPYRGLVQMGYANGWL